MKFYSVIPTSFTTLLLVFACCTLLPALNGYAQVSLGISSPGASLEVSELEKIDSAKLSTTEPDMKASWRLKDLIGVSLNCAIDRQSISGAALPPFFPPPLKKDSGVSYNYVTRTTINAATVSQLQAGKIILSNWSANTDFNNNRVKEVSFNSCDLAKISFNEENSIGKFTVNSSALTEMYIDNKTQVNTLLLVTDTVSSEHCLFNDIAAPEHIFLTGIHFANPNAMLDFTCMRMKPGHRTELTISNTDISRLVLDYRYFKLNSVGDNKQRDLERMYENQKKYFGEHYEDGEGFQLIDVELKQFRYSQQYCGAIGNFVNKYWWYYGYKKWLVFIYALVIVIIFWLINYRHYVKLLYHVYPIEEFIIADQRTPLKLKRKYRRFYSFLFTSYLFWGFKLDVEKIKLGKSWVVWILFQYVAGLVCLGFIVHFILRS